MPSPATAIRRAAAAATMPGDRGSAARSAVSQRDRRPAGVSRHIVLAETGRPLRPVTVVLQVSIRPDVVLARWRPPPGGP